MRRSKAVDTHKAKGSDLINHRVHPQTNLKSHRLNAHNEERGVFADAWYCVQRFSVDSRSTRDQPRMSKEDPNRIERDCEEVSEQCPEIWRYPGDFYKKTIWRVEGEDEVPG